MTPRCWRRWTTACCPISGITRSDLRDAYAEPLWRDPTYILASRAQERRVNRQVVILTRPSLVPVEIAESEHELATPHWRERYAL